MYRQRQEEGKSDSEEDEDDGSESFSVSVKDDNEDGKEHFVGFLLVYLYNCLKCLVFYLQITSYISFLSFWFHYRLLLYIYDL